MNQAVEHIKMLILELDASMSHCQPEYPNQITIFLLGMVG